MSSTTKVVGVTFDGRQSVIAEINEMLDHLIAIREPENPHDENAIAIYVKKINGEKKSVGYINRGLAAQLAPEIDAGKELIIHDFFLTGARAQGVSLGIIFSYTLESVSKEVEKS